MTSNLPFINTKMDNLRRDVSILLGTCKKLDQDIADEFTKEANNIQKELDKYTPKDDVEKLITYPYTNLLLDSINASVILKKEGKPVVGRKRFELLLQEDGLSIGQLDTVIKLYHESVEKYFSLQRSCRGIFAQVCVDNITDYERTCQSELLNLDRLASSIFGRRITTPADIDIKEKSPHHHLKRINVGFIPSLPELISTLAHEGPFGHYTHSIMSEFTPFSMYCRHTSEGVAILGEYIALSSGFQEPEFEPVIAMQTTGRMIEDAFGAAVEYLTYYKRNNPSQIVKKLKSRYFCAEEVQERLQKKSITYIIGAIPYFVGHTSVRSLFENVQATCASKEEGQRYLRNMYAGHRPVSVIEGEVTLQMATEAKNKQQQEPGAQSYK